MQRLLSSAVWDTDGVRDDLHTYTREQLGNTSTIVVIDETSFPKQGKKSAGVGVQYCGTTGQVENCQVGVFLDDKWSRRILRSSGTEQACTGHRLHRPLRLTICLATACTRSLTKPLFTVRSLIRFY
jgi:hypothetical protein